MNVGNRKLFSNRDARSKLSSMGGIMASSPELMGEAQRFAVGSKDAVAPSMFLVQVPGFIGGNEFLHLTSSELQLLSQSQPELMGQDGVVIQEATPEILSKLNPMQLATTDNNNVKRMFADLGVDLPEADAQVEAAGPGIMDRVSSLFGFGGDDSAAFVPRFPGDTQFQQDMVARNETPPAVAANETLGDVVSENPRTANRQAAFDKLKEQFSNLSGGAPGTIDTGPGFFSPESNANRLTAAATLSDQLGLGSLTDPKNLTVRPENMNTAADSGLEGRIFEGAMGGANLMPPSNQPAPVTEYDKLRAAQAQLATTEMFSGSDASAGTEFKPRYLGDTPDQQAADNRRVAGGIDTDAGQEITPEMAEQLKVLAQARGAGQVGGYLKEKPPML